MSLLLNRLYDYLDKNRNCSNCSRLIEKRTVLSVYATTVGSVPKEKVELTCAYSKASLNDSNVYSKNCIRFKRKEGHAPITIMAIDFKKWLTRQWNFHDKIITLIASLTVGLIIAIIGLIITLLSLHLI